MGMRFVPALVLVVFWLGGCTRIPVSFIPLDGAPANDLSQVVQIVQDEDSPVLLRGLDGIPLEFVRVPNDFNKFTYLIKPGRHVLWVTNVPYGHPLIPQKWRCYVVQAPELAQGTRYRLREDVGEKKALLLRDDTGATVSTGQLVDEPWIFWRGCRWE